jgi:hypothetical protein
MGGECGLVLRYVRYVLKAICVILMNEGKKCV